MRVHCLYLKYILPAGPISTSKTLWHWCLLKIIFLHTDKPAAGGGAVGGGGGVVMRGGARRNVRARIAAVQRARQAAAQANEEEGTMYVVKEVCFVIILYHILTCQIGRKMDQKLVLGIDLKENVALGMGI